jgi:hypothetical protein
VAEYEGDSQADALLAAIMDEPLPEEALGDDEFMAEHRSAMADVATLREQVRILGDVLAAEGERRESPERAESPEPHERAEPHERPERPKRPERSSAPAPLKSAKPLKPSKAPKSAKGPKPSRPPKPSKPRRPRRYAGVALGALVVAMGTAMLGGLVWLGVQGGADDAGGAGSDSAARAESGAKDAYSPEMHIACSKVLVEGTVRSITPTDDGNVRVVLDVKRYYRPELSVAQHPTIAVTLLGSARKDLKVGTYTLVRVPVYPEDRQDWETGWGVGDARPGIVDALPGARGLKCSGPQQGRG